MAPASETGCYHLSLFVIITGDCARLGDSEKGMHRGGSQSVGVEINFNCSYTAAEVDGTFLSPERPITSLPLPFFVEDALRVYEVICFDDPTPMCEPNATPGTFDLCSGSYWSTPMQPSLSQM